MTYLSFIIIIIIIILLLLLLLLLLLILLLLLLISNNNNNINSCYVLFVLTRCSCSDGVGKEIISLYKTEIDNGQVFWGDLNARQMLWRKYAELYCAVHSIQYCSL